MSRSNPHENTIANPSTRWFEWNGENGVVRYYDKERKQNVEVGSEFSFILLDRLGSVGGWHEASKSSIYSNEVKDTRQDVLLVRAFKGGTLAEGLYKDIRDRVNVLGGQFVANLYLGYKVGDGLALGCLRMKGAALGAWMEFEKAHRGELYSKAIRISGYTEGKKGRITFRVPVLKTADLSKATNDAAVALDVELQAYLSVYLKKNKREQVETGSQVEDEPPPPDDIDDGRTYVDEIPF